MDADGTNQARLTNFTARGVGAFSPAWSPDGRRIAFQTVIRSEIYVVGVDGTGLRRLTSNRARDSGPAWSPDGRRIAFSSTRDGNWEVYTMDADGANVVGPGSLIGVGELPEPRRQPGHGPSPRLLGGDRLVVDRAHRPSDELVVVEEQQVRREDVGDVEEHRHAAEHRQPTRYASAPPFGCREHEQRGAERHQEIEQ